MPPTHEVNNQPPPLEDFNAYEFDPVLSSVLSCEGAEWAGDRLRAFGAVTGSRDLLETSRLANLHPPMLHTHDRFGHRIDEVEYHPAYHELMRTAIGAELHSLAWTAQREGAHVARMALKYLWPEAGTDCPIIMTHSAVPVLRVQPELAEEWVPRILTTAYDGRCVPATEKPGITFGMTITEKQGGSDVRAIQTSAVALGQGGPGGEYHLTGHKWFCSAPMSDAFITLAQVDGALSCFLVPRFTPDGKRNPFHLQRLKTKIGNRSNASSEIEFADTWARMIGEPGRGIATVFESIAHSRLDVAVGGTSVMRHALVQAIHHCRHRSVFGKPLIQQPLMQNILADLALESEAATRLAFRVGRALDRAAVGDERERAFARITTSVAKYWCTKRVTGVVAEALECHGGNGYIEDAPIARHFREAPLGSIWEGSGNVQCLDVLRAMRRSQATMEAVLLEVADARAASDPVERHFAALEQDLASGPEEMEFAARNLVERLAVGLQAALLLQDAPTAVAEAFIDSRLCRSKGAEYGTLAAGCDAAAIIERALPG